MKNINNLDNLYKMKKFLETHNLTRLNYENLSRSIIIQETKSVIRHLPTKKRPGTNGFTGEAKHLKKK